MSNAISSKDYETARSLIDEDRLADQVASDVTETIFTAMQQSQTKELAGSPFAGFGSAMLAMLKPQIASVAKSQVKQTIDDLLGAHSTLDTRGKPAHQIDKARLRSIHLASVAVSGNTAEAVFDHLPSDTPKGLNPLRVRLAHEEGTRRWRVVAMPDVSAIFAEPLREALERK
ncbi:hypothetical protein [Terriglobus sp.]|uniref:hypothetical protein n=1 Tax=Terriglobus sp. TaxID=1889013 RepID=UPI003AFFC8E0